MKATHVTEPFYGTYHAQDGRRHELRSPADVYRVFRELLKRMPGFVQLAEPARMVVFSKREPGKRFLVQSRDQLVPMGVREGVSA